MLEQNPDTVKIVFKNFPLSFHRQSRLAATAAYAAYKQGKFWQYHDLLYQNYNKLSPEKISQFAKDIGLDMATFNRDRNAPSTIQHIQKDILMARKAGVNGTPAIFINGHRLASKDRNLTVIQQLIDRELAKVKK